MPHCEWINCLTGTRGNIASFPEALLSSSGAPSAFLRISPLDGNVELCPHSLGRDAFLNGENLLVPTVLPAGVPATLRMERTLLALCVGADDEEAAGEDGGAGDYWAREYRFPFWTIFDAGTLDAIETVARPADIPAALARNGLSESECLLSPFALPLVIPAHQIAGLLF